MDHLEHERGNSVRTRNARLAAIHSLFRYAPSPSEHAAPIPRVLAIPPKRSDQALINYLTEPEVDALLATPDRTTWTGRRDQRCYSRRADRATDLRADRATRADMHLGAGAHVACHGKGRKDRITPLTSPTVTVLRDWLAEHDGDPGAPCSPPGAAPRLAATRSNAASPTTSTGR